MVLITPFTSTIPFAEFLESVDELLEFMFLVISAAVN